MYLPNLVGGGAERVTLNLATGLARQGQRVDLVLASKTGDLLDQVPDSVRVVDLGAKRTITSLPSLLRYLRSERPDGLLSAINHANLVAISASRLGGYRGPVIATEHIHLPAGSAGAWQFAFNQTIRLIYPFAHKVVAVSHGVKRSLIEHGGVRADRVDVIYNPVIGERMLGHVPTRPAALPNDGIPTILGVGRLSEQKNFPLLIRAFARLRQVRDARLLILGQGPDRDMLRALADDLGLGEDVALPGFVPNPYDYLASADLFVLSSDWEGLPTVLIEALALGTPVVSTDCPSGPQEILQDGAYGRLVPMNDEQALAESMLASLETPHVPVPQTWRDQFLESSVAAKYLALFRSLQALTTKAG